MRLVEQVDRTTIDSIIYSWLLEAGKSMEKQLPGWKWINGRKGCFVTNDIAVAKQTAGRFNIDKVTGNGTHATHGACMSPLQDWLNLRLRLCFMRGYYDAQKGKTTPSIDLGGTPAKHTAWEKGSEYYTSFIAAEALRLESAMVLGDDYFPKYQ
jgi:hypothetical protein